MPFSNLQQKGSCEMKRILSTILVIFFFCTGLSASAQHAPPNENEARAAAWAADDWKRLESAGIWLAPPGTHDKDRKVWRKEAAVLFQHFRYHLPPETTANIAMERQRAAGAFTAPTSDDNFDVYQYYVNEHWDSWSAPTVILAIQSGLLRGYPDHRFRSDLDLTRSELATIVCRLLLHFKAPITFQADDVVYTDVSGDEWWIGAAQTVSRSHLMQGYPDTTFRGEQPVTRDEVVVVLARVLALLR